MEQTFRIEHDFLGEKEIPNSAYYGVQTLRAKENFHITGICTAAEPLFIEAFAYVKKAAAMANCDSKVLEPKLAKAIIHACDRLIAGEFHDQFVTDMIQGGAGTSVNMNMNEVIANIGLEYMGYQKGQYEYLHPNNHINCSQSTNDTYATALMMAVHFKVKVYLQALRELRLSFLAKSEEFKDVLKMGRTQLQDAVPMTLGQEFHAWATTVEDDINHLSEAQEKLTEVNMGATAIGTSINAPKGYPELCTKYLAQLTGLPMTLAPDLIEATSDMGTFMLISGMLKRSALKISKICNDLRLLSSGPRAGLNEITLPPMQPGSSIMPGKVNPVIPEVVNQTAFYVMGADVTISMAAEAGQLQLNVMEPVIAFSLFTSMNYMINAIFTLRTKCIDGIKANIEVCREEVMRSIGIVTALNPILGYETASEIAKEALRTGKAIHDIVVVERKLITQEKWDEIYTFENMVHPVYISS
ncbi:MAG: aspartate ammonia-lyase [Hymenobacteraceae bacterium]|nr:aspartate ammonia-lyase [Hymenobacteraceae bacterium]MDX5394898.1 aspartate ammonia-lyase [Hymenobacteraceae bacterium]MDX5510934.1 aspartate ammonia-lyase [Hymenobacteraceae bacterium]